MLLERAADWGKRDGFAALRKNLGSASLGKDKEVAGNIGQCARPSQCIGPLQETGPGTRMTTACGSGNCTRWSRRKDCSCLDDKRQQQPYTVSSWRAQRRSMMRNLQALGRLG